MTFSKETLESTFANLDEKTAMTMLSLAGTKTEFETLVRNLARNFNATIPARAYEVIDAASMRYHAVPRNRNVSYAHP